MAPSKTHGIILLVLLNVIEVSKADWKSCRALIPPEGVPEIPTSKQLTILCPSILSLIECYGKELEMNVEDSDEQSEIRNEHLWELVWDICNQTSRLRRDYINSIECFKRIEDKFDTCLKMANSAYMDYKKSNPSQNLDEELVNEANCFTRGHAVGCMTEIISSTCGTLQLSTYIEILQRSRYLEKFCDFTTAQNLRTTYMDYLNSSDIDRDIYELAFEYEG